MEEREAAPEKNTHTASISGGVLRLNCRLDDSTLLAERVAAPVVTCGTETRRLWLFARAPGDVVKRSKGVIETFAAQRRRNTIPTHCSLRVCVHERARARVLSHVNGKREGEMG